MTTIYISRHSESVSYDLFNYIDEEKQSNDWDYKLENGESLNEVSKRMHDGLIALLEKYTV